MTIVSQAIQNGPRTYAYGLTAIGPASAGKPTTQAQAAPVPALVSVWTNIPPGGACVLPTNVYVTEYIILNRGANTLIVLPGPSWSIETNAVNTGVSILRGGWATFLSGDPQSGPAIWYAR